MRRVRVGNFSNTVSDAPISIHFVTVVGFILVELLIFLANEGVDKKPRRSRCPESGDPAHEAFRPRSLWSLFNAFTEAHKTVNPHTSLRRGEALHGLFDAAADLALPA